MKKRIKLKVLIAEKGMTQKEVAEKAGIKECIMSQIVNGTQNGKIATWRKIAEVLGVEIGDIIE